MFTHRVNWRATIFVYSPISLIFKAIGQFIIRYSDDQNSKRNLIVIRVFEFKVSFLSGEKQMFAFSRFEITHFELKQPKEFNSFQNWIENC